MSTDRDFNSRTPQAPKGGRATSARASQTMADYDSREPQRRKSEPNRVQHRERKDYDEESKGKVSSFRSADLEELRRKSRTYKIVLISVISLYVITVLSGVLVFSKKLESIESEYEVELEDSRAYTEALKTKVEKLNNDIDEKEKEIAEYEEQIDAIASLISLYGLSEYFSS